MKNNPIVIDYAPKTFKQKLKKFRNNLPLILKNYVSGLMPIFHWIHKYNLNWLVQDVIAGITVGIVIVPQSMAYAKIANLDPQYGLYTSFAGVSIYCLFGTSKDISLGPISTVALLVGSVISSIISTNPEINPAEVATTIALFSGIIMILISLLRLGVLVDFIPEPAIAGYMTGSAITIVLSQTPKVFGIPDVSTSDSPYLVFIHILTHLSHTRLDVAFGLTSLVILYSIKYICGRFKLKSARKQKLFFLFGIMRNGLIVIVGTLIAFCISRKHNSIGISIIESVPAGFGAMAIPSLNFDFIRASGGVLPSIIVILILEHISVSKSFGRIYDYQINPDQEIFAIGISNVVASCFGGFSCTGAFSRTAIMARSGSKTPLAGLCSGFVVVLALYALTPAFYYIPNAVLSAVVIHAVSDLASSRNYLKNLWATSGLEFFVWVSAVVVTVFVNVETGIYAAVGLSLLIVLYRLSRPPIKVLAQALVCDSDASKRTASFDLKHENIQYKTKYHKRDIVDIENYYVYVDENDPNFVNHFVELPHGVIILRPYDSILYPNVEYISDAILDIVKARTRCGNNEMNKNDSDRPWSHETSAETSASSLKNKPIIEALIFDFSAVCRMDATAVQILNILRESIDKYAGRSVEWHFTNLNNPSVRNYLINAGFGVLDLQPDNCSFVSLVSARDHSLSSHHSESLEEKPIYHTESVPHLADDIESYSHHNSVFHLNVHSISSVSNSSSIRVPIDKYPCFHWDIDTAVRSVSKRIDNTK